MVYSKPTVGEGHPSCHFRSHPNAPMTDTRQRTRPKGTRHLGHSHLDAPIPLASRAEFAMPTCVMLSQCTAALKSDAQTYIILQYKLESPPAFFYAPIP